MAGSDDNPVRLIAVRFGGQRALARALGHRNPTTVCGWVKRAAVPTRQIPRVIAAAQRERIRLALGDFFPRLAVRVERNG